MSFKTKHVFFAVFGLLTLFVFYLYETPFLDSRSPVWQHVEPVKWMLLPHGVAGAVATRVRAGRAARRPVEGNPRRRRLIERTRFDPPWTHRRGGGLRSPSRLAAFDVDIRAGPS